MNNQIDEIAILAAVTRGELDAFTKLYDMYLERIYRFVYYRLPHKEIAEDITSDVFVSALEKIASYNPNKASFATWLYTIARNKIIDHARKSKPVEIIEQAFDLSSGDNPAKDASQALDIAKAKEYLNTLDQTQRDIVIMRIWDELSHKEIAAVLNMSEAAVKMNYSRTIAKMQTHFTHAAAILLLLTRPL